MTPSAGCRYRHGTIPRTTTVPEDKAGACGVRFWLLVCLLLLAPRLHAEAEALDFTLKSTEGDNLRLLDYRGSVVILSFIKGRCRNCERQLRALDALHKRYHPLGLHVLGISADMGSERAAALSEKLQLGFPILLDDRQVASQRYRSALMPALVVVDKDGRQRFLHQDYREVDAGKYEAELRQLLNEWQ